MPVNLKELRQRIKSVKNTQQITKVMKMVSAANFSKSQNILSQTKVYTHTLQGILNSVSHKLSAFDTHFAWQTNASTTQILLAVASDRGLCGNFNTLVAKQVLEFVKTNTNGKSIVVLYGKKPYQILNRLLGSSSVYGSVYKTTATQTTLQDTILDCEKHDHTISLVLLQEPLKKLDSVVLHSISAQALGLFEQGVVGSFSITYSKFINALTQQPTTLQVLPMAPVATEATTATTQAEANNQSAAGSILVEESDTTPVLHRLIELYMANIVSNCVLQSLTSEFSARMRAMEAATKNGKELERKLQLQYQRGRQAAITTELIEIIGGSEAI
jgi:F-type H+-transporting ATPase subunit gamma